MAFNNVYTINVDLKRRLTSVVPTFKQGDSGVLRFRIYDDGVLYNLDGYTNSQITFTLPSGQTLLGDPVLENGEIVYYFTRVEMSEIGKIDTVLTIMSGVTQVSIQPFSIFIFDSMSNEDISYIGILQGLISEVQNLGLEIGTLEAQIRESLRLSEEQFETVRLQMEEFTQNETIRINNENLRISSETERVSNETIRINSESLRNVDEQARINAEQLRLSSETIRVDNELLRVENEGIRQLEFSRITSYDYDMSATYYKNNVVTYNGSSYIALKEVTEITPNDDKVNWRLLAQRGVDGTGAVSSVNGVAPDGNGNVTLELTPVINNLTSNSTTNALSANQGRVLAEKDSQQDTRINSVEEEIMAHSINNDVHTINQITGLSDRLAEIGNINDLETTNKSNIVEALNETFTQAVNGKTVIANAINGKGGTVESTNTFSELATAIDNISTGKKFASGVGISGNFASSKAYQVTQGSNPSLTNVSFSYVTVTGLNFKPSRVIITSISYLNTSNLKELSTIGLYVETNFVDPSQNIGLNYMTTGESQSGVRRFYRIPDSDIYDGGFILPIPGFNLQVTWEAYE